MFSPTTYKELKKLGWDQPDIILVTGDAYIDSPHIGVAVIGKVLAGAGFREHYDYVKRYLSTWGSLNDKY